MIKFVKFFGSDGFVKTLFTDTGMFQDDGQTHIFADAAEALAKDSPEAVVFWDGAYVGVGTSVPGASTEAAPEAEAPVEA